MKLAALLTRTVVLLVAFLALSACKLIITVPPGGIVSSKSGDYICRAGETCEIDIVDIFFDESFVARPHQNFVFRNWRKKERAFCGNSVAPCALSTTWMGAYPDMLAILESDQVFYLEPVFEAVPRITEQDLEVEGQKSPTAEGYDLDGKLVLHTGSETNLAFNDANLTLGFNEERDLVSLFGVTVLPSPLAGFVTAQTNVRAEVGLYRGVDINADEIYEIHLRDERQYLVFLVSENFDINVYNPVDSSHSEKFTIGTPASGKVILILDPADQMVYVYGESAAAGAYGKAQSEQGLLPYDPWIKNKTFGSFDGYTYEIISVGVGIKVFDFLNLSGSQVIYEPQFTDINWEDPLHSPVAYKAGYNGAVDFAFAVAGFQLFHFDLARASALFNVNPQRGVIKLAANLEPDVSWVPDWMPVVPRQRVSMDLTGSSDGVLVAKIGGAYESLLPRADLEGSMRLDQTSVTYHGRLANQQYNLPVSIRFANRTTTATVGVTADFSRAIANGLDSGFDAVQKEVKSALAELASALEDFEFEVSLRGVRDNLPGIVDSAIGVLNGVPDTVYSVVNAEVKKQIDANNVCTAFGCVISNAKRNSLAASAASSAESKAISDIAPYKTRLANLKQRALEADDENLRAGLETALREVYAYRTFKATYSVKVSVSGVFSKTVTKTVTKTIIPSSTAAQIVAAADNMKYIPAASDRVFRGQQLVDSLPDASLVDEVRNEVEKSLIVPPGVTAVSYTVKGNSYSARVKFSDGGDYTVNFNVLDVVDAIKGITKLMATHMVNIEGK